jgi:hypothetical protein
MENYRCFRAIVLVLLVFTGFRESVSASYHSEEQWKKSKKNREKDKKIEQRNVDAIATPPIGADGRIKILSRLSTKPSENVDNPVALPGILLSPQSPTGHPPNHHGTISHQNLTRASLENGNYQDFPHSLNGEVVTPSNQVVNGSNSSENRPPLLQQTMLPTMPSFARVPQIIPRSSSSTMLPYGVLPLGPAPVGEGLYPQPQPSGVLPAAVPRTNGYIVAGTTMEELTQDSFSGGPTFPEYAQVNFQNAPTRLTVLGPTPVNGESTSERSFFPTEQRQNPNTRYIPSPRVSYSDILSARSSAPVAGIQYLESPQMIPDNSQMPSNAQPSIEYIQVIPASRGLLLNSVSTSSSPGVLGQQGWVIMPSLWVTTGQIQTMTQVIPASRALLSNSVLTSSQNYLAGISGQQMGAIRANPTRAVVINRANPEQTRSMNERNLLFGRQQQQSQFAGQQPEQNINSDPNIIMMPPRATAMINTVLDSAYGVNQQQNLDDLEERLHIGSLGAVTRDSKNTIPFFSKNRKK